MQQKPTRKLNSQFAVDFGVPDETQVGSGEDQGIGKGYTIGAAAGFCLVVASFANIYFSHNDATKVARGVGYLLVSTGTSFVFVIGYQMVQRIGIRFNTTIIDPRRNPRLFWFVSLTALLFFTVFTGSGVWLCFHAGWVAKHFS